MAKLITMCLVVVFGLLILSTSTQGASVHNKVIIINDLLINWHKLCKYLNFKYIKTSEFVRLTSNCDYIKTDIIKIFCCIFNFV